MADENPSDLSSKVEDEEKVSAEKDEEVPSIPPNNSNGSGDASSSSGPSSSSATRRPASVSLGDNNSSEPKQPRLSNMDGASPNINANASGGNGRPSNSTPPPPPPLTGAFEIFQNLPQQVVRELVELRRDLNQNQLMDQIDSMMEGVSSARFQALGGNKQAILAGLVKLLHWLSSMDSQEVRECIENFQDHLDDFQDWLADQNLSTSGNATTTTGPSLPVNPPQPNQQHFDLTLSWGEVMSTMWAIGPVTAWRLRNLFEDLTSDGLLDEIMQTLQDIEPNVRLLMHPDNLQNILIPAVADWILDQDREELREQLTEFRRRMQLVLDWMDEQGL